MATTIAESNLSVKNFSYLPPRLYKGAIAPGLGAAEQARFYISGSRQLLKFFPKRQFAAGNSQAFRLRSIASGSTLQAILHEMERFPPKSVSAKRDIKIQIFPNALK
jgi:hypothetical protein